MARKSLRPQLNQIRAWVRQGRTDAWIAHQLEISANELRDFRQRHGLEVEGEEPVGEVDLRDEIEAEIEAELDEIDEPEPDEDDEQDEGEEGATDEDAGDGEERPRRRRRRGGRGRGRGGRGRGRGRRGPLEAAFDHGEQDGYGLWLDPAVKDDPVYNEHWAGQRALKVTIEPERIVLERVDKAE